MGNCSGCNENNIKDSQINHTYFQDKYLLSSRNKENRFETIEKTQKSVHKVKEENFKFKLNLCQVKTTKSKRNLTEPKTKLLI